MIAAAGRTPRVLMLTRAYHPDVSGGGVQCRTVVRALRTSLRFTVLTMTRDSTLPRRGQEDGVPIVRVALGGPSARQRAMTALRVACNVVRLRHDILHLHGFTDKSILGLLAALFFRRRTLLTVHTAGNDDPGSQGAHGAAALRLWLYRRVDRVVAVSPGLREECLAEGLFPERILEIPNGVECDRFRPAADAAEKAAARAALGWPNDRPVILFVGFFSRDKGPHVAVETWRRLRAQGLDPLLVMVGSTDPRYHEVDAALVERIRRDQASPDGSLRLVERAADMAACYRGADVFVLPSVREGSPLALLEAMASGLPCIAFRLEGATDAVITSGEDGILVPTADVDAFAAAVAALLRDVDTARRLGLAARRTAERRHSVEGMARAYLRCYRDLMPSWRV